MALQKGYNFTKGDNTDLKNMDELLFFDKETIYEISKHYLKFQIAKGNNSKKCKGQKLEKKVKYFFLIFTR